MDGEGLEYVDDAVSGEVPADDAPVSEGVPATDEQLQGVADAAAAAALAGAHDQIAADSQGVADAAASGAVAGVQERLDAALDSMASRDAAMESVTQTVELSADQYDGIMTQLRVMAGADFLSLCLLSALFGAFVWSTIVRGYR